MKSHSYSGVRFVLALGLLACMLPLAACSVARPPELATEELLAQATVDQLSMYSNQESITGPITEEEAIARAVKYNLQHRLSLMERALADNLTDLKRFSMLPKLTAQAGYRMRDNDEASSSVSVHTGRESLEPSMSREKDIGTADLEMTWNILDFGLSYIEAKAHGNKTLAAEERRRRVVGDIVRQTRAAYWAAVSAEKMRNEVAETLTQANEALAQSKEAERRLLLAPVTALRYQRDLLNMMRQIEQLDNELARAKARLAALMNLAPGTEFQLAIAADELRKPQLAYSLEELEVLAMVRRPELREESYLARNAVLETRMSIMRMFPNASLFGGAHFDSNKYLVNANWASAGAQVSWNMLNVFSLPAVLRAGETRENVAELRRQAMRMTVLSQVHVAWHQRVYAQKTFDRSQELSTLQTAINTQVRNAAASSAETQLELVRTRVETLLAKRARDLSYAEMQNAQDALYQAVGLEAMPQEVADISVRGLADAVAQQGRLNEEGGLALPAQPSQPYTAAVALPVKPGAPIAYSYDRTSAQPAPATGQAQAAAVPAPVQESPVVSASAVHVGDATQSPAVRLVRGQPWSSVGSLKGLEAQ